MTERQPPYTPPDFIKGRTAILENRINAAFAAAFQPGDAAAQLVLDYLSSITLQDVLGPGSPDSALRHREGQRDLVRIIKTRIDDGRNSRPSLPQPSAEPAGTGAARADSGATER